MTPVARQIRMAFLRHAVVRALDLRLRRSRIHLPSRTPRRRPPLSPTDKAALSWSNAPLTLTITGGHV